jgi:hypothetical protein
MNHAGPRNLARDRASPQLAGHAQGYLETRGPENAVSLKRLRHLCRSNPGRDLVVEHMLEG